MSLRSQQPDFHENVSPKKMSSNDNVDNTLRCNEENFELKKKIGLPGSVAIVTGTIVGSGIFMSPVSILAGTNGSVGLSLVLWAVCGLISALSALCYCELGTAIQESGGTYAYLHKTYVPVVAFTFIWSYVLLSFNASNAASAVTFGSYIVAPFYVGDCKPPDVIVKCAASAVVIILYSISYVNVKAASKVQSSLAIAKFIGMAIIIIGGLVRLGLGDKVGLDNFQNAFRPEDLTGLGFTQIGLAFYQGLFSFGGWANLTYLIEEVKDAKRTLPLAILIAVPLVTVFYLLVNIGYFAVLTPQAMLESDAVAVTWSYKVLGGAGWIMSVVVCLSTIGALNGSAMSSSRLPFAAARRGHMPTILSMVTVVFYTPGPALILNSTLTIVFLLPNNFDTLVNATSFTSWLFFGFCFVAIIVLRFTHPDIPRPFKVPIVLPGILAIVAAYLVIAPLVEDPDILVLYTAIFICCGPFVYFVFVYKKIKIPGVDFVTRIIQQTLNVAPTDWKDSSGGRISKNTGPYSKSS